jgi:signal transduction histidine kinase
MQTIQFVVIYFFYGLAFFSMGLLVLLEGGRSADARLRRALRPLAAFGLIHGANEWVEMFIAIATGQGFNLDYPLVHGIHLAVLAFSFVSLGAFGAYLLAKTGIAQRYILLVPIGMEAVWVFGLLSLRGRFLLSGIWEIADVWTRYSLAVPAAILAAVGLIVQQRAFRQSGLITFGRDSLYAAVAFGWYGLVGQLFTRPSLLPPSNVINQVLFEDVFGFPVQLFRALTAMAAAFFVIRFLRAFQVETDRRIADLQAARLAEAQQSDALRGELFRRVVGAQEAERQRIARDLHDETGQSLTAVGMGLRGLATMIRHGDGEQAARTLRSLETLSTNALTELQRLIADLRPSHLDDLGLSAALRWYAGTVQERTNLQVRVDVLGDEVDLPSALKVAVFRVVQEALNNVIKHAEATHVQVHVTFGGDAMRVLIKDNGRGFDPGAPRDAQRRASLGLVGMQERVNLFGGTFHLQSQIGQGAQIEVSIPYRHSESEMPDDHSTAAR